MTRCKGAVARPYFQDCLIFGNDYVPSENFDVGKSRGELSMSFF